MEIIHKNQDFMLVNKPTGVEFHGAAGCLEILRQAEPRSLGVHRLDKETSGLMLVALNKRAQSDLSLLFEQKIIQKYYIALSDKKPTKKMGKIQGDLLKGRGGNYYLSPEQTNPSVTYFFHKRDEHTGLRCFVLKPRTGKTHQLRVVMKSLSSAILGDKRYNDHPNDRMYLHAYRLVFNYQGEEYDFEHYPDTGELFLGNSVKETFEKMFESEEMKNLEKKG